MYAGQGGDAVPKTSVCETQPRIIEHRAGDMLIRFEHDVGSGHIGLVLLPVTKRREVAPRRSDLHAQREVAALRETWPDLHVPGWTVQSLVHCHIRGDVRPGAFASGRTLLGSPSTDRLCLVRQTVSHPDGGIVITTHMRHPNGLRFVHRLSWRRGDQVLRVQVTARNAGRTSQTIELLTSAALGGISPFVADDAPGRLSVHRYRSCWCAEGRAESLPLERLHLERSWSGHGIACERFGQTGSLPVRGFHPTTIVSDAVAGVSWGLQLSWLGSWQIELFRRDDRLLMTGGLADFETGHWARTLAPGERFVAPEAALSVVVGDADACCRRLVAGQRAAQTPQPASEQELPPVFNEWCSSWGNPTHDRLVALADRLAGSGVRYLVIDDGWAQRQQPGFQQNGDWIVDRDRFPAGLRATTDAIRARGLIPGLWFEFEAVNPGSRAWKRTRHLLHRDGEPLQVGPRRFWDFRDPWVGEHLAGLVIGRLRDDGFGYLKVDYNDSIGAIVDGPQAGGENLRAHLAGVHAFFARIRRELPEVVLEMCSSGGHRLEPMMLSLAAMGSFSDAHETTDIPIIAANLLRLMPASQSQVWAVLRPGDSPERLAYSLAATCLGRMALSGQPEALSTWQWDAVRSAIAFHRRAVHTIASGSPHRFGPDVLSWRHPQGWQAVRFDAGRECVVVAHAFAGAPERINIPLPEGRWRIADAIRAGRGERIGISGQTLLLRIGNEAGIALRLVR
jgi:alpha-galactosidase